jgi:hypothetical protein
MSFFLATWKKVSLVDFGFYFPHFLSSELCSHWLRKNKAASSWLVKKVSQRQLLLFFNAN